MERRNLVYGTVLAALCVAIVVVVVLILRKQASLPSASLGTPAQTRTVSAPTGTVPLSKTRTVAPWKKGDPVLQEPPSVFDTPEATP